MQGIPGTFYDNENRLKCSYCLWVIKDYKCKCDGGPGMGIINGKTMSNESVYFTQWLQTATKGNVQYSLVPGVADISVRFWCKVCSSKLSVPYYDDFKISAELQEYVKFHRHDPEKPNHPTRYCPMCERQMVPVGMSGVQYAYTCPQGCSNDPGGSKIWTHPHTLAKPSVPPTTTVDPSSGMLKPGDVITVLGMGGKPVSYTIGFGGEKTVMEMQQQAMKQQAPKELDIPKPALRKNSGRRFR